ncbi:hypothetical protein HY494_00015 [Candidatus Woesearchaeota archaeon]|nr:hypothetical protein [Candidatus Woesearchaeota archaeon]
MVQKIELKTRDDKTQLVYALDQPLSADQVHLLIPSSDGMKALWERHIAHYESKVKLKPWKEDILAVPSNTAEIDFSDAQLCVTTSYYAQMVRDHGLSGLKPLTVQGIVRTSDERILVGVRQGFVQNGKVSLMPLGYAAAPAEGATGNPLFQQLYAEAAEEIGLTTDNFEDVRLLGYQTDPEFTQGINLVFLAQSKLDAAQVQVIYDTSYAIYSQAHDRFLGETNDKSQARRAAKKAVTAAGFPNLDVGDHHPIVFLEDNFAGLEGTVGEAVRQGGITLDRGLGPAYPLMAICRGGLRIYQEQKPRLNL